MAATRAVAAMERRLMVGSCAVCVPNQCSLRANVAIFAKMAASRLSTPKCVACASPCASVGDAPPRLPVTQLAYDVARATTCPSGSRK